MSINPYGAPATRLVVSLLVNNASGVVWRAPWRLRCLDRFTDFGLYGAGASWDGPRRPIIDIVPTDAPQRGPRTICIRGIPIDPDDVAEFNAPYIKDDVARSHQWPVGDLDANGRSIAQPRDTGEGGGA